MPRPQPADPLDKIRPRRFTPEPNGAGGRAAASVPSTDATEAAERKSVETWWDRWFPREALGGLFVSLTLHSLLLLIMALIVIQPPLPREILSLLVETDRVNNEELERVTKIEIPQELDTKTPIVNSEKLQNPIPSPLDASVVDIQKLRQDPLERNELLTVPKIDLSSHFGGRSSLSREQMLQLFGGTLESERAVERGLKWLVERQQADGSWSFDHRRPRDRHADHQAGSLRNCPIGATALALMAFLGAGETQVEGRYRAEVLKGVEFLLNSAVRMPEGADLRGRNGTEIPGGNYPMYAHGLATIALCECYAMTRDRRVRLVAQGALDFIIQTRNRDQGGWRYQPEQTGDLSVSGWMIMALQSGKTAGLRVSEVGFVSSEKFLDSVQHDGGAQYGYVAGQGPKLSTTSIGLLCRMYLGWNRELPALTRGIRHLGEHGPDSNNIYYNYYATQVLHHAGGSAWPKWNEAMRDSLVRSQRRTGPEAGSWDVTDPHGGSGGRLYQTCLSIMTLEVYYRHLPLYQMQALGKR